MSGRAAPTTRSTRALGLVISWSAPPLVDAVLCGLLGVAASDVRAEGASTSTDGPPRVAFDVTEVADALPYAQPAGSTWTFHHDHVAVYANEAAFWLQDDASEIRVPRVSGPIVARLHARTLSDWPSLRTFFDVVLTLALRRHGVFHLHAGGVSHADATILFAGESGAGKTTSTLALVEAGWSYLADDSVFLRADVAGPPLARVTPAALRRPFHLTASTLAAYPYLRALAEPSPMEPTKVWVAPERAFPGRFRDDAPPATLLFFPVVTGSPESCAVSVSDAEAFGRLLLASTLLSVPFSPNVTLHLALLRALVEGAACYELRLGADFLVSRASAVRNVVEPLVARTRPHASV